MEITSSYTRNSPNHICLISTSVKWKAEKKYRSTEMDSPDKEIDCCLNPKDQKNMYRMFTSTSKKVDQNQFHMARIRQVHKVTFWSSILSLFSRTLPT